MDFKQIQELIKMVNKSNLSELTIEEKDFKVTIKQKEEVFNKRYIPARFRLQRRHQLRNRHQLPQQVHLLPNKLRIPVNILPLKAR